MPENTDLQINVSADASQALDALTKAMPDLVVDGTPWRFTNYDGEWTAIDGEGRELGVSVMPVYPKDSGPGTEEWLDGGWKAVEPESWMIMFMVYHPGFFDTPPEWDSEDWETRPTLEEAMRDGWAEYQRREQAEREAEEAYARQIEEADRKIDEARARGEL